MIVLPWADDIWLNDDILSKYQKELPTVSDIKNQYQYWWQKFQKLWFRKILFHFTIFGLKWIKSWKSWRYITTQKYRRSIFEKGGEEGGGKSKKHKKKKEKYGQKDEDGDNWKFSKHLGIKSSSEEM